MSLIVKIDTETSKSAVPAGTHVGVCNLVVDLGMQPGSERYPDPKPKIYLGFEVPGVRTTRKRDGQTSDGPALVGRFYTLSMREKAFLRQDLESWLGTRFTAKESMNLATLLGQACTLSIAENPKGYADIIAISGLPQGMQAPSAEGPLRCYDSDHQTSLDDLPEFLRTRIRDAEQQIRAAELQAAKEKAQEQEDARLAKLFSSAEQDRKQDDSAEITDDDIPF